MLIAITVLHLSGVLGQAPPRGSGLTLVQRVSAARAIERVAYSHQVGASRPFEEAVTGKALERKVRASLRLSLALERIWDAPITAEDLRGEAARVARDTRMPGRLVEIYGALGATRSGSRSACSDQRSSCAARGTSSRPIFGSTERHAPRVIPPDPGRAAAPLWRASRASAAGWSNGVS